jgi:hypothetical protein
VGISENCQITSKDTLDGCIDIVGRGSRPRTDEITSSLLKANLLVCSVSRDPTGKKIMMTAHKGTLAFRVEVYLEGVHPAFKPTVRRLAK